MDEAYGTNDGFRTYHTARGRDVSQWNDAAISAARLVGSEWIDANYGSSFPGWKVGMRLQVRQWPRYSAMDVDGWSIPSDSVPNELDNATYEAALRQLINPGSLAVDWTPQQYKRATVEGAVSVEYMMYANASDVQTRFQAIDEILAGILNANALRSGLSGDSCRG